MAFFKGQEQYSIDAKGRVNVPSKMRKALSPSANDTFVITRGVDECIVAYPFDEWKKYEEKFEQLNQYDEKNRYFLRVLLMWSEDVKIDAQQRIALPKALIEFAGIDKQVAIIGMIDHIEFWNPDKFRAYLSSQDESYGDVAGKVMTL
ncbi:MAG: division/cell wall cluster transcriptional repressor MraZ [Candidatus Kapabacteria bacterium]|nr:division/cell wall cluster transcriptional repressor MraZ [Candidatus Kapabacteria bacterium]